MDASEICAMLYSFINQVNAWKRKVLYRISFSTLVTILLIKYATIKAP